MNDFVSSKSKFTPLFAHRFRKYHRVSIPCCRAMQDWRTDATGEFHKANLMG